VESPRLIIIDVWAAFRPPSKSQGNQWEQDYAHGRMVKQLVDAHGCAMLILHHTKKAEAADVFDEISGTLGLMAAVDTGMVLTKARNDCEAILHMTGRDLEEGKIALNFDKETCTWHNQGPQDQQEEGKVRKAILEYLRSNPTAKFTPIEISDATNQNAGSIRMACLRMISDGAIRKEGGKYSWPGTGASSGMDIPI